MIDDEIKLPFSTEFPRSYVSWRASRESYGKVILQKYDCLSYWKDYFLFQILTPGKDLFSYQSYGIKIWVFASAKYCNGCVRPQINLFNTWSQRRNTVGYVRTCVCPASKLCVFSEGNRDIVLPMDSCWKIPCKTSVPEWSRLVFVRAEHCGEKTVTPLSAY